MAILKRTLAVERMEHVASKMKNTKHYHNFSGDHSVQLSKKKLTSDQISLIAELHKAGSTPTSIRETLVQQNPDQRTTQNFMYAATARASRLGWVGRPYANSTFD